MKIYHSIKRSAFIIMDNPFSIKIKPYANLKVCDYKKGFP